MMETGGAATRMKGKARCGGVRREGLIIAFALIGRNSEFFGHRAIQPIQRLQNLQGIFVADSIKNLLACAAGGDQLFFTQDAQLL